MKKILFTFVMLCSCMTSLAADKVWCMVANTGQIVQMSNVSYILAEGAIPETFDVILKEGDPLQNIGKIVFKQLDVTGINSNSSNGDTPILSRLFDNQIILSGVESGMKISVYSLSGVEKISMVSSSSELTTVSLACLVPGIYLLKVGSTSVKFTKK